MDANSNYWKWFYLSAYNIAVKHGYQGTEEEWINQVMNDARESAAAAAASKAAAEDAQTAAEGASSNAEAYSVGTRGGDPVTSEDVAYHNNAKYYSEEAGASETAAEGSAEDAEAWAVGQRGGVDVGSEDPTYHNNSKYYYDEIGTKTAGVVADWLDEHVDPDTGYVIDNTFTIEGAAPDSKATGDAIDNVKSAIDGSLTLGLTGYYKSGYIDLSGDIGSTVSTTPVAASNRKYIVYPCKAGDIFMLTGYGPSSSVRIFAFTDSAYKLYSRSISNITYTNNYVVSPIDGYFISNVNSENNYALSVFKKGLSSVAESFPATAAILKTGYITTNTGVGTVVSFDPTRSTTYSYAIIPCKSGDIFSVYGTGANAARLWAFLDVDRKILSVSGVNATAQSKPRELVAEYDGYFVYNTETGSTVKAISVVKNTDVAAKAISLENLCKIVDYTPAYTKNAYIDCNKAEGSVIDIDNPTANTQWNYCVFPVKAGDYVRVTGTTTARLGRLWAFLDSSQHLLSVSRYAIARSNYLVQAYADGYFVASCRSNAEYGAVHIENGSAISEVSTKNAEQDRYYYARMSNIGLANTPRYLKMCNCYGNPENVHPKVLYIESGFGGHPYWMAYTPYPSGDTQYENPCVAWSDDGFIWTGIAANPLADRVDDGTANYNSDTHLVLRESTLECWYRWADDTNDVEVLYRRTSTDGITWTAAEEMYRSTGAKSYLLSPAIIWDSANSNYRMWVISSQGGYAIKYYESDSAGTTWTEIRRIELTYVDGSTDYRPWHLDLIIDNNNYIALVMAKDSATTTTDWPLFVTTSADNITYSTPQVVMTGNSDSWDQLLYRSSIVKVGDKYRIYYSAKSSTNRYGVGVTEGSDIYHYVGRFDRFEAYA